MMREKKPEKDLRGKRQKAAVLGLNSRQQYMLSYLSRAQKAQWKSYSPVQQRKILEEIEKKLDRKNWNEEEEGVSVNRASFFRPEAFREETFSPREYRNRGHPEPESLRQVREANIRSRKRVLSASTQNEALRTKGRAKDNPKGRPGDLAGKYQEARSANVLRNKAVQNVADRRLARKSVSERGMPEDGRGRPEYVPGSGEFPQEGRRLTSMIREEELQEKRHGDHDTGTAVMQNDFGRAVYRSAMARQVNRAKDGNPSSGNHKDSDVMRIDPVHRSGDGFHQASGMGEQRTQEDSYAAHGVPTGAKQGKLEKQEKNQFLRHTEKKAVSEDTFVPDTAHNPPGYDKGEAETIRTDDRKSMEHIVSEVPAPSEKLRQRVLQQERDKKRTSVGNNADQRMEPALEELEFAEFSVEYPLAQIEQREEIPRTKRAADAVDEETELFKTTAETVLENRKQTAQSVRTRRRNEKRQERYRKAFLAELIRVIEKDMAKDQNIRQAQKSGQIAATTAELTGQTGRSTIRTAAIPLRVTMNILMKRLREELQKRLKEAAAVLARYAVTFGAPVFMIAVIVMLLASICMIGTTESSPRGTGLGFKIVQEAKKHLGLPYVYGGTSLVDGCDCSGFVWAIYNIFGYNLPRTAGDQYAYGRKVSSDMNDWQLGDLIYYSRTGSVQSGGGRAEHIVIYIGGGQVISCGPVAIYNWDYRSDYYGTCRIIPDEPTGGDFSGSTNEEICWNYFISQGFSEAAAAGILGNMYVESGGTFDPSIHQYGGGPGRGLCQWEESYSGGSGRYNSLVSFAAGLGKEWDDITAQLQFVSYELDSGQMNPYFSPCGGVEAFKNMTDATTATYVFLCGFEYCGNPGTDYMEANFALSTRVDHAEWAYLNYQ